MPKLTPDYSHTIIYKLCCKDRDIYDIYIGHTTNFTKRKTQHKIACQNENCNMYNRYVYEFIRYHGGWDNWNMVQIQEHNCKNKREAESIEHNYIQNLAATLNSIKPYAKCKEEPQIYKHEWYEEHKSTILEKSKEYYNEHKEKKIEYQKQYSITHKEEIKQNKQIYAETHKEEIKQKKQIYRETHKEQIKQSFSNWKESNKDKLKEYKSQIISCECGSQFIIGNKNRHLQSKTHINFQNNLCNVISEPIIQPQEIFKVEEQLEIEKQKEIEQKIIIAKEKQKEYQLKNFDKIKEYKKVYNENNKERISEQNKNYKENHKNEIIEQTKIYVDKNKNKIKQNKQDWYIKNKEKILQKQKEIFLCECGSEVRIAGKTEHTKSIKHIQYMENVAINNNTNTL